MAISYTALAAWAADAHAKIELIDKDACWIDVTALTDADAARMLQKVQSEASELIYDTSNKRMLQTLQRMARVLQQRTQLGAALVQQRLSTRSQAAAALTLASLSDDIILLIVGAFDQRHRGGDDVPLFVAVKGLGCLSWGMRQQLHRLRPLVGVQSLAVVQQRPAHGPWRVTLLYTGQLLTEAVMEQARQGRVRSIDTEVYTRIGTLPTLAPAVARRVVPELLGAGSSLLDLALSALVLNDTWVSTFGEVAVCSVVLRSLSLRCCGLRGPLPELRLPALQVLKLYNNHFTGGLEPLRGCTALLELMLGGNRLTGELGPLRSCTALRYLYLNGSLLTGGLGPLRGCTALRVLYLHDNQLTGGLEPLQGCTALRMLNLEDNNMTGGLEPLRGCTALKIIVLNNNQLTGGLGPLRACTAVEVLRLNDNLLTGGLEPLRGFEVCEENLSLENNQLVLSDEDKAWILKLTSGS